MGKVIFERYYSKSEIRIILRNPGNDLSTPDAVIKGDPLDRRAFQKDVYPIVLNECKHLTSLNEFKKKKLIPHSVVSVILKKLL